MHVASAKSARNTARQAFRLLQRPDVAARIEALRAERSAHERGQAALLVDKLAPLYRFSLRDGDPLTGLQCAELEARITGLASGSPAIRTRVLRTR